MLNICSLFIIAWIVNLHQSLSQHNKLSKAMFRIPTQNSSGKLSLLRTAAQIIYVELKYKPEQNYRHLSYAVIVLEF